jgi:FKBP-type peptidyl-prolyl cis-trans isomerase FkpA
MCYHGALFEEKIMNPTLLAALTLCLGAAPLLAADAPAAAAPAPAAPAAAPVAAPAPAAPAAAPAAAAPAAATPAAAPADAPAAAPAKPAAKAAASAASFKSDDERAAYAYGYKIGQNIQQIGMSESEVAVFARGLRDAASGKNAALDVAATLPKVGDFVQKRAQVRVGIEKKKGKAYADKFAKQKGVQPIPKGGYIQITEKGSGALPGEDDTVKVNYRGTLIDGTVFDDSYKRGEPTSFPLKNVIPCWTNGVAMMKVGSKAKLVCPAEAAYGDAGQPRGGIAGGATLVFEIELLEATKGEAAAKPAGALPN